MIAVFKYKFYTDGINYVLVRYFAVFLIFHFYPQLSAQCCNGNAAGPELVVNGDFSKGNTGFNTSYTLAGKAGLGRYGITANAHSVHPDFWSYCYDHTTGSDSFMWVDLSGSSSVNIWTQGIRGLSKNKYYLFTCWVNNLGQEGPGTLQFSINNQLVGKPLHASTTLCSWVKFCYLWYSSGNTTAVLTITNQSSGGSGNDCGIDDISFRQFQPGVYMSPKIHRCEGDSFTFPDGTRYGHSYIWYDTLKSKYGCDSIIGLPLEVHPYYNLVVPVSLCDGETYRLPDGRIVSQSGTFYHQLRSYFGCDSFIKTIVTAHDKLLHKVTSVDITCYGKKDGEISLIPLNGEAPFTYEIKGVGKSKNGVFASLPAGSYSYIIKDVNGCSADGQIELTQPDEIQISVVQSGHTVELNTPVQFSVTCNYNNVSWHWTPAKFLSCDTCCDPTVVPDTSISYRVLATTMIKGKTCTEDTVATVRILPFLFMPDAFTPNNDRLNDGFGSGGKFSESIESFHVEIFNNWGCKVFKSDQVDFNWDGWYMDLPAPAGVYVYVIKYKVKNIDNEMLLRGTFNLLR